MDEPFYDVIFKQALVIDNGSGLMKADSQARIGLLWSFLHSKSQTEW
jgi:hypothetical protein